jgi:hypothetical protein
MKYIKFVFSILFYIIKNGVIIVSVMLLFGYINALLDISKMYSIINSEENLHDTEKYIVEKAKSTVVNNLELKCVNDFIIDSIKTITIRKGKNNNFLLENNYAIFFSVDSISKTISNSKLLKYSKHKSDKSNAIIINKKAIKNKQLYYEEVLIHELYHYVYKLLKLEELNLDMYLSKNIDEKEYFFIKTLYLNGIDHLSLNKRKQKKINKQIKNKYKFYLDNKKYYQKNEEVFVRWKTFKNKLVELNYLDNIYDNVTSDILIKYISDGNINKIDEEILMFINFDKIEDFDKAIDRII